MRYYRQIDYLTAIGACILGMLVVQGCTPAEPSSPLEQGVPTEEVANSPYGREDFLRALQGHVQRWNPELEQLEDVDDAYLADQDYLVFYFSASWCPPCVWFSPILEKFYQRHAESRQFEVILVGNDRNEEDHQRYVAKLNPGYAILRYDAELESDALMQYAESLLLPGLRVLDRNGKLVLSTEPAPGKHVSPRQVLRTLGSWLANAKK